MPRTYIPAWPDVPGQRYDRTLISETQSSPLTTAGDTHGQSGNIIVNGSETVIMIEPRRFRYRIGWDALTFDQAVDVEHAAVALSANGTGTPIPYIEWEVSDQNDYPSNAFYLAPGHYNGANPFVGAWPWWQSSGITMIAGGLVVDPAHVTITADSSWQGNIPTFSIPSAYLHGASAGSPIYASTVTGRRIRLVAIDANSYVREKSKGIDRWMAGVTLVEKETGICPGYSR